jgi:hypothetical protein
MLAAAAHFGYKQGRDFYYIAAHANRHPHICAPDVCGFPRADMTQYLFAGTYDRSIAYDYFFPQTPPPKADPLAIFPRNIGDRRFPNHGNERLTYQQCRGALQHPAKYHAYLKGTLRHEIKLYRDRCWRIAKFKPPTYAHLRAHPVWADSRHLGTRWQRHNDLIKKIDKL